MARWIDDYFGEHAYGVEFSDERVFDPAGRKIETLTTRDVITPKDIDCSTDYRVREHESGLLELYIEEGK